MGFFKDLFDLKREHAWEWDGSGEGWRHGRGRDRGRGRESKVDSPLRDPTPHSQDPKTRA